LECRTGAGHYVLSILAYEIRTVINARVGKHKLTIAALSIVDYVQITILVWSDSDFHAVASVEHGRRTGIGEGIAVCSFYEPVLNRQ
jgi:hypothetical protein